MKPVLRPRCDFPAWFGLGVDCRGVFFHIGRPPWYSPALKLKVMGGAGGGEGRREERREKGKVLGCSGLCFRGNIERDGLSQGWLRPLESL